MKVEIHITTSQLIKSELEAFIAFCKTIDAKPIIIELDEANVPQHPMISKTEEVYHRDELDAHIEDLKHKFEQSGYSIDRVKMEVDFEDDECGKSYYPDYKGGYYEWHGQVSEEASKKVSKTNHLYSVHISQNALRDRPDSRLLTIRSHKRRLLKNQVGWLKDDLRKHNITLTKENYEYAIFDSNKSIDSGWIETPEITDQTYLNLLSFEAFLRRAAQLDLPFMLKGSLLSRQFYKNKQDRVVEDIDFLFFGEVRDDIDYMKSQLSQWAQAVTEIELDDGVEFKHFNDNQFWRMIEYAMHEDFPTVDTDLSCTVKNTENSYVGLDVSWGLPLNVKPTSLMYQPIDGEPFKIKYTTPLCLQISWKLHQCVVRPRLKDLIDICDLLRDTKPVESVINDALNEYIAECQKDNIDPLRILNFVNGSIREYLNYKPKKVFKFFNQKNKVKKPLPSMGELTNKNIAYLRHTFTNYHKRYSCVDGILKDFENTLRQYNIDAIINK